MKAIFIDPFRRSVEYVDVARGRDLSDVIKGDIALAHIYDNGDTLYVNDNGISEGIDALRGKGEVFRICQFDLDLHQPFFGLGILVGDEDEAGEITDVKTEIDKIRRQIQFIWPAALAADTDKPN